MNPRFKPKINIYSDEEIAKLREGGALLSRVLAEIAALAKPGATSAELDALAERRMREAGGEPSFKGYKAGGSVPFPGTVCISLNHEVVHAPPVPARAFKDGDIAKLDIGVRYQGLCTDMAVTVPVGSVKPEALKLIRTTRAALLAGVGVIRPGAFVRDVGRTIQPFCEKEGFSVVRDLVGHGVGYKPHEDPPIPNYDDPDLPRVMLNKGMVLAVEPMINAGSWQVELAPDQWTVCAIDRKPSAHFEVTVAVTEDGHEILTPLPV
jgi:methionyl aminopeptidase